MPSSKPPCVLNRDVPSFLLSVFSFVADLAVATGGSRAQTASFNTVGLGLRIAGAAVALVTGVLASIELLLAIVNGL